MSKTFILLLSVHFLLVKPASAQFSDTTTHYAAFTSTGSVNKTNDGDTYLLNNAVKFSVRKKSISLNSSNNWMYGKQDKNLTNNDFSSSLDFNLYKTFPHFFYWGLLNYNTSYSLKINNQFLAGAGIAYNIIDKKNIVLNLSDGILYDKSDLYLSDTIRDSYHTFRNSFRLLYRMNVNGRFTLDGTCFLQNSVDSRSDYIVRANSSLSFKIVKWLSFTTTYSYNEINRTKRKNSLLSYGLTLEQYF